MGETAQLLKCVDAHLMPIKNIQFNMPLPGYTGGCGERTLMLTASRDKTCKLWELQEYSLLKTYKSNRPLNDAVVSPLYQIDPNSVPIGDKSEGPKEPRYHVICGGGIEARDVTTSVEGGFESVFFHLVSTEELCQVKGHFGPMNAIAMSPSGGSYVTGGEDGMLRIMHFDQEYFTKKEL